MAWRGRSRKGFDGFSDLPGACPITWAAIAINAATFLASFAGVASAWDMLVFDAARFTAAPWTAISYALVASGNIVVLLLAGYVFWMFGGSLERSWGGRDYLVFLILVTAAPAVALWGAFLLTGQSVQLAGLWLPVAATTVAWAAINPSERLMLYFVVPIEARWLGLVAVALVFFEFRFPMGLFALAGCGVAWWYVRGGKYRLWGLLRGGRGEVRGRPRTPRVPMNPLAAIQRWRRKRQFARLVKRSGLRDLDS